MSKCDDARPNTMTWFYGSSCADNSKGALNTPADARPNTTTMTWFYGSSCADNGKGAPNTPDVTRDLTKRNCLRVESVKRLRA
eukprot:4698096-Pyramimonas_sp.AAC.1